jgi:hypothetical protein
MSKAKKGGAGAGGDESAMEVLMSIYPKKFYQLGIPMYQGFDEKMKQFMDEDIEFEQVHPFPTKLP